MKIIIIFVIAITLTGLNPIFPEDENNSQILSTDQNTLDVRLTYGEIILGELTTLKTDFINPQTQEIQEHIDWSFAISKDREIIWGPTQLTHTSEGSLKNLKYKFEDEGIYNVEFEIEGILFQPIPPEKVNFEIIVGEIAESESTKKIPEKSFFTEKSQLQNSTVKTLQIIEPPVKYNVSYEISGGSVGKIIPHCKASSISIMLNPSSPQGMISLDVPRSLVDAKIGDDDDMFFVLLDGEEINFNEINHEHSRELSMSFNSNSKEIEIIGTFIYQPTSCKIIHNPPYSYILSPLKQTKSGVEFNDVICRDGFYLILKSSNTKPACITPESLPKLIERGWAKP